jgi:hypothetical protein
MATQSDYEERAVEADRQAERALTPEMAERWRAIANEYRDLAAAWGRVQRRTPSTPLGQLLRNSS